ncbi:MAG: anthranilate synthase component I, partial [Thermoproteota archaeon]|nr:anthranilate synthase component I [Thermoproteota archaeon]
MIAFGNITGNTAIHVQKLATSENQFQLFQKLYSIYERVFILESLIGPEELSEMSVIGFDPKLTVTCDRDNLIVKNRNGEIVQNFSTKDPLSELRKLMPVKNDDRFRYIGGAVGYISYDAIRFWEHLPEKRKKKSPKFPLLEFGIYDDGIL